MSTLDTKSLKKQSKVYLIASISCIIFAIIYELFSHEVYSNYMVFSFLIPLVFGLGISILLYFINRKDDTLNPRRIGNRLYNAGIATLTFGSIFNGVLEIYGTTNSKIYVYLIVRNSIGIMRLYRLCNKNYKKLKMFNLFSINVF